MLTRRTVLYRRAVDLLLERGYGVERRGVKDTGLARDLLQRLSLKLQEEGGESWPEKALDSAVWALFKGDPDLQFKILATWGSVERLLEDLGINSGVLGPHDGGQAPWRFLHRSLREYLAAERLDVEGPERIGAWTGAWEGAVGGGEDDATVDSARWGEVHGLLCGLVSDPLPLLERLRAQSTELARHAVLGADIEGDVALGFLLETEGWEEEEVLALARTHGPGPLWARVRPRLDLREQAALWYALGEVDRPDPAAFFRQVGRSLGAPPPTVRINAGTFTMGSPEGVGNGDEHPAHRVTLNRAYRLGVTPVTDQQWKRFTGEPGGMDVPATGMTWYEARLYCVWVGGDLPTEAEWEYSCRAGSTGRWCFGDDEARLGEYAWYDMNAKGRMPVGGKKPNAWGLHDMHGNVWEWCVDDKRAYDVAAISDPRGALGGGRVIRGGAFWGVAVWCRSACRAQGHPCEWNEVQGFRVRLPAP